MNSFLENDQQALVDEIRRFVEREVLPVAHTLEHDDLYPTDLVEKLKHMGIFSLTIPERYGGLGLDFVTYARIIEQIARGWMSLTGIINTHLLVAYMIATYGTEEQRQHFLPIMAMGEKRGGLGLSEAGAGSDVQAIAMTAVRDGDHYVLNGSKMWVTNGVNGSIFAILARTDTSANPPHRGMSVFIVERGTPGLSNGRVFEKLGYKGVDTAEVILDNVRVPAEN
ncbi:MAG: acyl-CoA dehydrogenase family protein, partial [Ktedonobacteraceae bacterium]